MNEQAAPKNDVMHKVACQIVERRDLIFLIVVILLIFSVISRSWVSVENDLTTYLPETSGTRQALDIMEEEFTTYGTADVMVANIGPERAQELADQLAELKGVQTVDYDETSSHYNNVSALYSITFDYPEEDEECQTALDEVENFLAGYDLYVSTSLGDTQAEIIAQEVNVIMVYVAIIVVAVLIFTSQTYAEIPVLLLTFVISMVLNSGTNFLFGTISFVSNSVTSILQLALSLDYAIIFSNHFREEHETLPLKESVIEALSKSIPEISSSCLTTVGGLVAMMFMQFKIGPDMAICLIKAIAYSILSVFLVMPGLLMIFGPWMEKTEHKSFVPKIPFVGRFAYKTRKIIPPVFLVLVLIAYHFSSLCPYAYGLNSIKTPKLNDVQIASNMIDENFTASNYVALVTPKADYSVEKAMITELESHDEVDSIKGLSNIEAMDGYCLEDKLTARSSVKGRVRVNGVVKGEVHGNVSGIMNAVVNVGGIVGRTDGFVSGCINQGAVYGRKDVGGIAGQAEPTDYETLIALENAPKRFGQITVTFKDEDHVLGRVNLEYGDSLDESGYPELPAKEGCAARWSTTKLTELHLDTVVEAVYTDYITALASIYEREDGRPVFFAKESFGDRDSLTVSVRDLPGELHNAVESWQLTIPDDGQESHTVRYLPIEVGKKYKVYAKQDGSWKQLSTETIGSYLAFDLPGNTAELAVVPGSSVPAWVIVTAAAAVVLAGGTVLIRRRKKAPVKQAEE